MNRRQFLQTASTGVALTTGVATGMMMYTPFGGQRWRASDARISPLVGGVEVALEPVATGFVAPLSMEPVPNHAPKVFIADQPGRIYLQDEPHAVPRLLLDLSEWVRIDSIEMGLLGIEPHPHFADNRRLFVRYSAAPRPGTPAEYNHTFVLSELAVSADLQSIDPKSERVLLELPQPGAFHQSGSIEFGPDGYLYVSVGDGGQQRDSSNDPLFGLNFGPRKHSGDWYLLNAGGNGQNLKANLLGSILRIDVDETGPDRAYGIPDGNPLVGTNGLPEQYAWGFRNPYSISFSGSNLFVCDVGQTRYEEVNIVEKGGNYGWNVMEGTSCLNNNAVWHGLRRLAESIPDELPACPTTTETGAPLEPPVVVYPHLLDGEQFGVAVVAGELYQNATVGALEGKLVIADFLGGAYGHLFATQLEQTASGLAAIEPVSVVDDVLTSRTILSIDPGEDGGAVRAHDVVRRRDRDAIQTRRRRPMTDSATPLNTTVSR